MRYVWIPSHFHYTFPVSLRYVTIRTKLQFQSAVPAQCLRYMRPDRITGPDSVHRQREGCMNPHGLTQYASFPETAKIPNDEVHIMRDYARKRLQESKTNVVK